MCREEGVDVCFEPTPAAMYPKGFQTIVTVPSVARRWEGEVAASSLCRRRDRRHETLWRGPAGHRMVRTKRFSAVCGRAATREGFEFQHPSRRSTDSQGA